MRQQRSPQAISVGPKQEEVKCSHHRAVAGSTYETQFEGFEPLLPRPDEEDDAPNGRRPQTDVEQRVSRRALVVDAEEVLLVRTPAIRRVMYLQATTDETKTPKRLRPRAESVRRSS